MTDEKAVKEAVKRRLKKFGAWWTMPHQAGFSQRGVPDIIACYNGRLIGIECKYGKNKPTPLQTQQMENIERAGGTCMVVNENNLDEVEKMLKRLG